MPLPFSKKIKLISLHLVLIAATFSLLLFILFQYILPTVTRYGKEITVPDLKGMSQEQFTRSLEERGLRYQTNQDEVYSPSYPPGVVMEQHPPAGAHVKRDRTIYLTINSVHVPEVTMPNLVDGSVRNAYMLLKEKKLICDSIDYVPDLTQGAVVAQYYQEKPITAGEKIPQGASIHLLVGGGLAQASTHVPPVINKTQEAATLLLLDAGLGLPLIEYEYSPSDIAATDGEKESEPIEDKGIVIRQEPTPDSTVVLGTRVQLWLRK